MKSRICQLLSANQGGGRSLWSAYGRSRNIPTTACLNQSPSPNRTSSSKMGRRVAVLSAMRMATVPVMKMLCSVLITAMPVVGSTDVIPI